MHREEQQRKWELNHGAKMATRESFYRHAEPAASQGS